MGAGQCVKKPYTFEHIGLAVKQELSDAKFLFEVMYSLGQVAISPGSIIICQITTVEVSSCSFCL